MLIKTGHWNLVLKLAKIDETKILSASFDKEIKMWDVKTGQKLHTFKGHNAWIWRAFSVFNERYFISGDEGKMLIIWDY